MYCKESEVLKAIDTYLEMNIPDRFSVIFYSYTPSNMYASDFPVNLLRNVGIHAVHTSHYVMLDMDIWVNHDMYNEIHRIPPRLMNNESNIFIVPVIFLNRKQILKTCDDLKSCVLKYVLWKWVIDRSLNRFPVSKSNVTRCLDKGHCFLAKGKILTHVYLHI